MALCSPFQANADVGQWTSIGPSYISGEGPLGNAGVLFSVALDPTDSQTIYVSSHHTQGVFKTTDGGGSWTPITDSLPGLAIAAIAVDPSAGSRVYAALPDTGVFRSENGGADWQLLPGSPSHLTDCCDRLVIDPTNSDALYMTSLDGVYRSLDRGATWQLVYGGAQASDLIMRPTTSNILYAGIVGQGVAVTTDGGNNWILTELPTSTPGNRGLTLALSLGEPDTYAETLYALVLTNSDREILASEDGGATFSLRSADKLYRDTIGVDPMVSTRVYVSRDVGGSNTIIASDDGGVTFGGEPWGGNPGPHLDHHRFLTPGPGIIYTVCDGGIFLSTDSGKHWSFLGKGLSNVEFYDIANAPTAAKEVIGGTQDNGSIVYDGSSTVWRQFQGGDGATVAVDPTDAKTVYAMDQFAPSMTRVDLNNNSGECIACGLVCTDGNLCRNLYFQVHPTMSDILLAASEHSLWRSVSNPMCSVCPDGGLGSPTAWTAILTPQTGRILRATVDASIDLYYAGSDDGNIYAGPSGDNWQTVFTHPHGAAVSGIEVDPDDPATVYASFAGTGEGRVYRLRRSSPAPTTMDALDITQAAFALPSKFAINTVAVDRGAPLTIYAGIGCSGTGTSCGGIYRGQSVDEGKTWHWIPYNNGFPLTDVRKLEVHPSTFVMRAGTFGRSTYEVATSKSCQSNADCDDGDPCNGVETCRPEGVCRAAENEVPTADICTDAITAECTNDRATVRLDGSCSSDPEGCIASYQWTSATCGFDDAMQSKPQATCPAGTNQVALTVQDAVGASSTPDTATIKVVDTMPPVLSCSVATPVLKQNNHDMVNVGLVAAAQDQCEGTLPAAVHVFGDEDDQDSIGDGMFSPDADDLVSGTLRLRAERKGNGDGRVYLIVTDATDTSGNRGFNCCTVTVPLSSGQAALASVQHQAATAKSFCLANNGQPPPGYFVIGDGAVIGPKQ
jgi:photosystem II stability/assembly factor-like uncharacterized protein